MPVIEQTTEHSLAWQNINWTAPEKNVRRIQERIFQAGQAPAGCRFWPKTQPNARSIRRLKTFKNSLCVQHPRKCWESEK
jgi:hypothetical protein